MHQGEHPHGQAALTHINDAFDQDCWPSVEITVVAAWCGSISEQLDRAVDEAVDPGARCHVFPVSRSRFQSIGRAAVMLPVPRVTA
jgi:hypothetical protein